MSRERSADGTPVPVSTAIDRGANARRWHALEYLHRCRYPATVTEVGEYVASQLAETPDGIRTALRTDDLPTLVTSGVIEYDADSRLVCTADTLDTFEACIRRAIEAGAVE